MSDVFSPQKRSAVMARIRGHGNRDTELRLIAILRAHGVTGWRAKILRNRDRDRAVGRLLRRKGWRVARIWEHALRRADETRTVARLRRLLG